MRLPKRNFNPDTLNTVTGISNMMDYFDHIRAAMADHVDAGDHYDAITPSVANQEFKVAHRLNAVPNHFLMISKDGIGDVYKSSTAWTKTAAYFKCSGVSLNVRLLIW